MTGSTLDRRDVAAQLIGARDDILLVAGLGGTVWDSAAAGDRPLNFYLWGGMGNAAMVGLGLALAQPERRVLVLTGDGEQLMGLGALATIGVQRPANLAVVVIDNELYGETGRQPTHTAHGVDLAGMARAAGIENSRTVRDTEGLAGLVAEVGSAPGPIFAVVKISQAKTDMVLPPRDGAYLKSRFRGALLGVEG